MDNVLILYQETMIVSWLYWRISCLTLFTCGIYLLISCKRLFSFRVCLSDFNRFQSISMVANVNYPHFLIGSCHFSSLFLQNQTICLSKWEEQISIVWKKKIAQCSWTHQMTFINSFSCCKAVDRLLSITKMASRYNGMAWPPCTGTLETIINNCYPCSWNEIPWETYQAKSKYKFFKSNTKCWNLFHEISL